MDAHHTHGGLRIERHAGTKPFDRRNESYFPRRDHLGRTRCRLEPSEKSPAGSTGNGTLRVRFCAFRDSLISASIASGGAVAVVANGVFRLNVSASSFRDSVIGGSLLSGADLVVVVGGSSWVQLDDVAFDGAFVRGARAGVADRDQCQLVVCCACSAEYFECGLVCAVDVDMLNGSIADNAVESSRGVLFGNGQWEDVNSVNTLCSRVALSTTRGAGSPRTR